MGSKEKPDSKDDYDEEDDEEPSTPRPVKKPKLKKDKGAKKKSTGKAGGSEKQQQQQQQFIGAEIDPNEPTYCLCDQVSFGEMIGCDNDDCEMEWFHFSCVNLTIKPKGKWYCPNCRGDKSTVKGKRAWGAAKSAKKKKTKKRKYYY